MANYKIGDKTKFAFAMGKTISDVQDVDFEYTINSVIGRCTNCGELLINNKAVRITKLISIDDAKHYVGYSDERHTLKLDREDIPKKNQ